MVNVVTKKVRLTRQQAAGLRRLAQARKTTESDVLRDGLVLLQRQAQRAEAIDGLIAMIDGPEPPKVRWRPRAEP